MWIEANVVWLALVGRRRVSLSLLPEIYERIAEHEAEARSAKRRQQYEFREEEMWRRRCFVHRLSATMEMRGPVHDIDKFDIWWVLSREGGTDTWVNGPGFVRAEWGHTDGDPTNLVLVPQIPHKHYPESTTHRRRRQKERFCKVKFMKDGDGLLCVKVNTTFSIDCDHECPEGWEDFQIWSDVPEAINLD